MIAKWKEIWERKGSAVPRSQYEMFAANGYDTGGGQLHQEDYQRLVAGVRGKLGITPSSRVLDVGCGCGTVLRDIGAGSAVGVDYSSSLVRLARELYPQADFQHAEANAFEVAEGEFDAVFSFGVLTYLPDRAYAQEMLVRMARGLRPGGYGLLLDIPDAATRDACEAYRAATIPDYHEKYAATPHSYFLREDLIDDLRTLGCRAWGVEHFLRHYGYRSFRFNLQFEKPVLKRESPIAVHDRSSVLPTASASHA